MPVKKKGKKGLDGRKKAEPKSAGNGGTTEAISQLKCIIDPHTNISVWDMGLISELMVDPGSVSLTFRPTSPFCPLAMQLAMNIKRSMHELDGINTVEVTIVGHYQEDNINRVLKKD